jgi:hypothetical protein
VVVRVQLVVQVLLQQEVLAEMAQHHHYLEHQ